MIKSFNKMMEDNIAIMYIINLQNSLFYIKIWRDRYRFLTISGSMSYLLGRRY